MAWDHEGPAGCGLTSAARQGAKPQGGFSGSSRLVFAPTSTARVLHAAVFPRQILPGSESPQGARGEQLNVSLPLQSATKPTHRAFGRRRNPVPAPALPAVSIEEEETKVLFLRLLLLQRGTRRWQSLRGDAGWMLWMRWMRPGYPQPGGKHLTAGMRELPEGLLIYICFLLPRALLSRGQLTKGRALSPFSHRVAQPRLFPQQHPCSHQVPGVVGTPWDTSGQAAAASSTLCKTQLGLGTHHLVMPGFEAPGFAHPAGLAACHHPGDARHRGGSPSSPGAGSGGRSCRPPLGRASSHHPHAQPPSPAVSCENKRSRSTGQGDAAGSSGKAPAPTGRQSKAMAKGERCCVGSWG